MKLEACPFDSQFYALKIGRFVPEPGDGANEFEAVFAQARSQGFAVVFVRVPNDDALGRVFELAGYHPVETLVTSTLDLTSTRWFTSVSPVVEITHHARINNPFEISEIALITTTSIRTSHLHRDPKLPIEGTRALYAEWATNDITGRASRTIVSRASGQIVGYITVLDRDNSMVLDLVAVHPDWQQRGIGTAMLAAFRTWIGTRVVVATVGTQADNPALGLYQRAGFVPSSKHVTYHLWL